MIKRDYAGVVMVAAAAASGGTWSLFLYPTGLPAQVTTPIVFAVMGLVAWPLALRDPAPVWDRTTLALLAGNAAFDALNVITFFAALDTTTVAIAVITHYLAPILIALAAPRIDGTVARGARLAAVVALCGLAIVMEPWHAPSSGVMLGAALGLGSAVCYAGNVFVVRRLAARIGAARAVAYHSLIAAVLVAPFAIGKLGAVTLEDLARLATGGATIGAISGIVFVAGLARIGSSRTAVLTFAEPLVAVAIGALVWGQALHPLAAIGGVLVLASGLHVARQAR